MTTREVIQAMSREELESAFSQRERQLEEAEDKLCRTIRGAEIYEQGLIAERDNLKAALASSAEAGHAAFEAERKRADEACKEKESVMRHLDAAYEAAGHSQFSSAPLSDTILAMKAELAAFHAAMQRERKPDWEKWHMDLADVLDAAHSWPLSDYVKARVLEAARELRSMATVFTHKCNFVPTDLEIKALKEKVESLEKQCAEMRLSLEWFDPLSDINKRGRRPGDTAPPCPACSGEGKHEVMCWLARALKPTQPPTTPMCEVRK